MIYDIVRLVAKRPVPLEIVCQKLNASEAQVLDEIAKAQKAGSTLRYRAGLVGCAVPISADKIVTLGSAKPGRYTIVNVTDTHFGSAHCDEDALLKFLREAWKRGARVGYCSGDLLDGNKPVLLQDQRYVGFDAQLERATKLFKAAPPFKWVAIDGNHDGYYSASSGFIAGKLTETEMRKEGIAWTFAGVCVGRAVLHGARYHIWHPAGGAGTRNAVRRILNERAESMNEACDVLSIGHFHRFCSFQAYPERIFCLSGGTFQQKASEFANRITRQWDIGGTLVSHTVHKDGTVGEFSADFIEVQPW